jgi:hypothetical protein
MDSNHDPRIQVRSRRYFSNGALTHEFMQLNLRANDKPELVKAVVRGDATNLSDIVTVIFIVIYRLRNDLFHGAKWAYGIRGQLDNF